MIPVPAFSSPTQTGGIAPLSGATGQVVDLREELPGPPRSPAVGEAVPPGPGPALDPTLNAVLVLGDRGRIMLADPAAEALFGYLPGELVGLPVEALVPTESRAAHRDHRLRTVSPPGPGPMHADHAYVVVGKDGRTFPVEISLMPLVGADGPCTRALIRPVGGYAGVLSTLQHLELSQQMARMGSWEQLLPDGRMHWSQQMYSLLGLAPGRVTPSADVFYSHVHPDDRPELTAQVRRAHREGGRICAEVRLVRPDPSGGQPAAGYQVERIVAVVGAVGPDPVGRSRTLGTVQDVTDLRALRRKLQTDDQLLWLAFDDAPIGMCMVSARPGRIGQLIKVNRAFCELTGRSRDKLLGRDARTVLIAQDAAEPAVLLDRMMSGQVAVLEGVERRIERADGQQLWVRTTSTLMRDEHGAPDYFFLNQVLDITEHRAAHREAVARARRDQRIAAVLQEDLLPRVPRSVGPVQVAARYLPAGAGEAVGGDWHDVFALPYGRVGVVIGDVAGHGIESAATMNRLRYAARMLATAGMTPTEVAARLNQSLCTDPDDDVQMATLMHAQLDPADGVLTYASAGHLPLLMITTRPEVERLLVRTAQATDDPPIGAAPGLTYTEHVITLEPGSTLVGFTDGLIERRDQTLDDCLALLISGLACCPSDAADDLERLVDQILHAAPPGPREDDTAVIALALPAAGRP